MDDKERKDTKDRLVASLIKLTGWSKEEVEERLIKVRERELRPDYPDDIGDPSRTIH